MTSHELRNHLLTLSAERAAASLAGLDYHGSYIDDLRAEIEAIHHAFVGTAVFFANLVTRPRAWHFGLRAASFAQALAWGALGIF